MYLRQKKKNLEFRYSYLIILLILGIYIYNSYSNILTKHQKLYNNELVNYYEIFKQISKQTDTTESILVKNSSYINNEEMIDELSKSTPIVINKNKKIDHKYNITFTLFSKKELPTSIKKEINKIDEKCYTIKNDDEKYTLIGEIEDKKYLLITKYIDKHIFIKEDIQNHFKHILIFVLINIILFFYFSYTIKKADIYEKRLEFEYKKLQDDTKKLAFEDTLTKAATRLKFDESLNNLIEIANRFEEQKFTLIILDIDNFKSINDTHGHDYGDFVLKTISHIVKKDIRSIDTFARWGGEEFVILSPLSTKKESVKLANRVRVDISRYKFSKVQKVTCSFGLVEFEKGDTEESIIKRADKLLYKAKLSGKNRVEY